MPTDSLNIEQLSHELADAMPTLDEAGQHVPLAIYRLLANGDPVPPERVAERAGVDVDETRELLEGWPGVDWREGRIVGFWGLALSDMPHVLQVGTASK